MSTLTGRVSVIMAVVGAWVCVTMAAEVGSQGAWVPTGLPVYPDARVEMRVELAAADEAALEEAFTRVATPHSPTFRKYLTTAEIADLVKPAPASVEAVVAWMDRTIPDAIVVPSLHGDALLVSAAAADIASALGTRLTVYKHTVAVVGHKLRTSPTEGHTSTSIIPSVLLPHVRAITGLTSLLPVPTHPAIRRTNPPDGRRGAGGDAPANMPVEVSKEPGITVTPPAIYTQYNLTDADVAANSHTSQGVAAFEDAQFLPTDVSGFQAAFNLPKVDIKVLGPNDGGYFGEAGLDTQYITASGRGVPTWYLSQQAFDMTAWCELVLGNLTNRERPSVVSISWGSGEADYEASHTSSANACFQKMGLQGITVLVASGDKGTGHTGLWGCKKFNPDWPATSPYVTAVGGTSTDGSVETGWGGSGGGFSPSFPRPSYQNAAVAAYLSAKAGSLPAASLFNAANRATPDVAALATNFEVFSGELQPGGTLTGTSAAAPTFAGLISLINSELVAVGKPTLGFINPLLYAAGAGVWGVDITTGNNKASGCKKGFDAASGWDPVTGLGTPSFPALKKVLMA